MRVHLAGRIAVDSSTSGKELDKMRAYLAHNFAYFSKLDDMRLHAAGNDRKSVAPTEAEIKRMRVHAADDPSNVRRLVTSIMAGHPYRLVSYWYVRDHKDPVALLDSLSGDNPENLIMDSGLFSLMFGSEKGTLPETLDAYREYTEKYISDLDKWGYKGFFVEADVHRLLGMDAVWKLREHFEPYGDRIMYVWHQPEGLDGLLELAKQRSYICISIPELRLIASGGQSAAGHNDKVNRMAYDLLRRVHEACGDAPPRIHLLGCTVNHLMETQLAWSCDSTSWLSGLRFGNGCIWTGSKIEGGVSIRSERFLKFREVAIAAHPEAVDYAKKQDNSDYYLNCLACAHAYAQYQVWLDTRYSPVPMRGDKLPGGPIGSTKRKAAAAATKRRTANRRRRRASA